MKMTVAQALVEIICKEGIKTAFGIPGAAINPVYKYLEHAPIQHFTMRHEEACVHAADGYQRASHEIALAICSAGPGATNFVTPVYGFYRFHACTVRGGAGQSGPAQAGTFPVRGYAGHRQDRDQEGLEPEGSVPAARYHAGSVLLVHSSYGYDDSWEWDNEHRDASILHLQ